MLTGSLQHSKGMTRVTCELVDTRSHRQLRNTSTIAATDPFAGEDQVVESVLRMLQLELQPAERQTLGQHHPSRQDAYDLYLQGRGYLQIYDKVENLQNAITAFQRALAHRSTMRWPTRGSASDGRRTARTNSCNGCRRRAMRANARWGSTGASARPTCAGMLDSASGQYEAVTEFGRALEAEPTNDDAYRGLAEAYERMGDLAEAEKTYQRAIDLSAIYNWVGYSWMGAFYFHQSRFGDAAAMFNRVIALVPDRLFQAITISGAVLNGQGRYNEAIAAIQHWIDIQPDREHQPRHAYFYLRQYNDAIGAYEQAIKLKEADYLKWWNLGEGYFWSSAKRAGSRRIGRRFRWHRKACKLMLRKIQTRWESWQFATRWWERRPPRSNTCARGCGWRRGIQRCFSRRRWSTTSLGTPARR